VNTAELVARAEQIGGAGDSRRGLVDLHVDGTRVVLRTSERVVRRARARSMAGGVLAALAGCGLLYLSVWYGALIVAGIAWSALAPRRIRPLDLTVIDTDADCVIGSNTVPVGSIASIRGAFETRGWDGFSVISAILHDESSVPLLMLLGADDRLAEAVCSTLGAAVDRPAEYVGSSGTRVACHAPAA
jgi:hypothetical protein